jgi:hypothetical protein
MASGPVCRAKRPNTWLRRPACNREEKPCQLGAVHTWHKADMPPASGDVCSRGAKRTSLKDGVMSAYDPGCVKTLRGMTAPGI